VRARVVLAFAIGLLPGQATAVRPSLRGVVEGYYGRPWSSPDRRDVIRFMGEHGLNAFVYAPKNDERHRDRWREPYSSDALADFRATAATARRAGVTFMYALSPVLDVCYSCAADRAAVMAKLSQVAGTGIRRFVLLFDDGGAVTAPEDVARYGGSDVRALARAQADLVNHVRRSLARRRLRLAFMVPTDYAGTECRPYHDELGRALRGEMPVGWTGAGVFAETITADQARARRRCLHGHPVVLWDNYPANDTLLSNNLHLGPLTGRDRGLPRALAGYLLNPMTQPHASLVALGTAATYFRSPRRYDPEAAWQQTLAELGGGGDGLPILAAQLRSSALDLSDADALAAIVSDLEQRYAGAEWVSPVEALEAEETRQAGAPVDLAARLGDTPLATEIAPWVTELSAHAARGIEATRLLRALKPAFVELTTTGTSGNLTIHGRVVAADADTAAALGPGFAAEGAAVAARIAVPPAGPYVACLGDFLGADIHFCPEFGLNVHGKALFFLIHDVTDVTVVSDRNVHDRLVLLAARAYTEWVARRGPGADALALTLDGSPVLLGGDLTFSTPVSTSGGTLLVRTAAGEATARDAR
jgi:hypothetical protein